jgi:hypothetical protein
MKITYSLGICLIALSGCASTGAAKAPPHIFADETATVSSIVVRANNYVHPDCQASSAARTKVLEPGVHNSMEQWSVTCNGVERLYQVLIARLGGGITADVLEGDPIMLQPTAAECTALRVMLERAEASTEAPTADLIGAHQQVMYKTLACQ